MSEHVEERQHFTLLQVTRSIGLTLKKRYGSRFWVKAEINKLNHYKHSGHCYPDLVEKRDGKVVAQLRSLMWSRDFNRINRRFQEVVQEPLKDGIKILFVAEITFSPVHGLALQIHDIDPSYTVGDLEREKQETIQRLKKEHLYDLNREKKVPLLPQRIAVISVETSKGYADYMKVLEDNEWGYAFFNMLFPTILQGEKAVSGIIRQLQRIARVRHHFDVVAIIRGGGGEVGLSSFNDFKLAKTIADFPLPVLTGIGHATNLTVVEMVSNYNGITPTKLAESLIQRFHNVSVPVKNAQEKIADRARQLLLESSSQLAGEVKLLYSVTSNRLMLGGSQLSELQHALVLNSGFQMAHHAGALEAERERLEDSSSRFIDMQNTELLNTTRNVALLDPENVLKRGYSLTLLNGKTVSRAQDAQPGDQLLTHTSEGSILSEVQSINPEDHV